MITKSCWNGAASGRFSGVGRSVPYAMGVFGNQRELAGNDAFPCGAGRSPPPTRESKVSATTRASGAQRSVCASGRKGWAGNGAEIIPKGVINLGQSLSQPAADSSCCGTQNSLFAKRSQNFDHCHSFLLASSATGGARKRPPLHKGAFRTGDADCRVASLLAMTVLNLCHSEEAQRTEVGIRPFLRWTGDGPPRSSAPTEGLPKPQQQAGVGIGPYGTKRELPRPPGQRSERGKSHWSNSVFAR